VFGASGAIGRRVVGAALAANWQVRAFTRSGDKVEALPGVIVAVGDALDADAVARAVAGADAVVSALGPISNRREEVDAAVVGIRNILSAMGAHGVRRLVALNGAAVTMPGERKPLGGRIASAVVRLFVRNVVEAKQRELEEIAASDLDWTVVRPPRVTATPPAGRAVPGDRLHSRRISEVDLAAFMVSELDAREYVRRAPFVSG
jgi:putative NADH-flavin reductase